MGNIRVHQLPTITGLTGDEKIHVSDTSNKDKNINISALTEHISSKVLSSGYEYVGTGFYSGPSGDVTILEDSIWTPIVNNSTSSSSGIFTVSNDLTPMYSAATQTFYTSQLEKPDVLLVEISYRIDLEVGESSHKFRLRCTSGDDSGNFTFTKELVQPEIQGADILTDSTALINMYIGSAMSGPNAQFFIEAFCEGGADIEIKNYTINIIR